MDDIAQFHFDFKKPIVCTAIHNGNFVSSEIEKNLGISFSERLREEDAYTEFFTENCGNRIIGKLSRFEVDFNRDREQAIYMNPEDAWGLKVRKKPLSKELQTACLEKYDCFYRQTEKYFSQLLTKHPRIFVFDIHSYNHHRKGPDADYDNPELNPEIILGTKTLPDHCQQLVKSIWNTIEKGNYFDKTLDVRCNVKFSGGYFSSWVNKKFPDKAYCLSIEFKKIFMNEWTGMLNIDKITRLRKIFEATFPVVIDLIGKQAFL